jgi:hypothetical protein
VYNAPGLHKKAGVIIVTTSNLYGQGSELRQFLPASQRQTVLLYMYNLAEQALLLGKGWALLPATSKANTQPAGNQHISFLDRFSTLSGLKLWWPSAPLKPGCYHLGDLGTAPLSGPHGKSRECIL